MRSDLGKIVRKQFDNCFLTSFPNFQRFKSPEVYPGDRAFKWIKTDLISVYVMLCIHSNADKFTLELAWSKMHRFPNHLICMLPYNNLNSINELTKPIDGEFRTRIGLLLLQKNDRWWNVTDQPDLLTLDQIMEQAFKSDETPPDDLLINAKIQDAIISIRDYAIPYLDSSCATYG